MVFVANITDELILGLDLIRAYDASVDIGRQKLRLAEEQVSLLSPGAGSRTYNLVVARDHVIPEQCERIVVARIESPLGEEYFILEKNPQAHPLEGVHLERTLVQVRQEVPMTNLNTTLRAQNSRGSPLAHGEPVTIMPPPGGR
jgi:hypothetical protein